MRAYEQEGRKEGANEGIENDRTSAQREGQSNKKKKVKPLPLTTSFRHPSWVYFSQSRN